MIRGWRNDPRWVEFYAKRDNDRIAREIERVKLHYQLEKSRANTEEAFRRMRAAKPTNWELGKW